MKKPKIHEIHLHSKEQVDENTNYAFEYISINSTKWIEWISRSEIFNRKFIN